MVLPERAARIHSPPPRRRRSRKRRPRPSPPPPLAPLRRRRRRAARRQPTLYLPTYDARVVQSARSKGRCGLRRHRENGGDLTGFGRSNESKGGRRKEEREGGRAADAPRARREEE